MRLLIQSVLFSIAWTTLASLANAKLIGTQNPVNAVPDGGMTAILLGGALAALAVLRRFVKR
jgi:VPDSG-CTERM motif